MSSIPPVSAELARRLEKIEHEIQRVLPREADAAWLASVAGSGLAVSPASADKINEPAFALVSRGGKRWRPLVMLLAAELAGNGEAALPLTPLVELPHNGSLIVDDIEDGALYRRGARAAHLKFGIDLAINAGNHLYFLPTYLLERPEFSDQVRSGLYRIYLRYMRRLHLGQGLDILWHRDHGSFPRIEEYLVMCRMKTGCLAAMGAELGAAAGGAESEFSAFLGRLFENVGVSFQILDDVRNLDTGNPGKHRGDDIVEGKKSYPVVLHLTDHPSDAETLADLFHRAKESGIEKADREIETVIQLLETSGSIRTARDHALQMHREAIDSLRGGCPPSDARNLLEELLDSLLSRQ